MIYLDPTGQDYVLYQYDKDGKVINTYQVRDIAALGKGYTVYGGNEDGSILYVNGPNGASFTAKYVEGDAGGVRVQAQYEISALAEVVGFEMNRREAASLHAIEIIGAVNLAPAVLIAGHSAIVGTLPEILSVTPSAGAVLNQAIGPAQRLLLQQFLGQSIKGAVSRAIPEGLTRETLLIYREIAVRALQKYTSSGASPEGIAVQAARIKLINEALEKLK